jgi:hypothetical protein
MTRAGFDNPCHSLASSLWTRIKISPFSPVVTAVSSHTYIQVAVLSCVTHSVTSWPQGLKYLQANPYLWYPNKTHTHIHGSGLSWVRVWVSL